MQMETLNDIRQEGLQALTEKLGYSGMLTFLEQYSSGTGDYTKDRHKIHKGKNVESIVREIKAKRKKQ